MSSAPKTTRAPSLVSAKETLIESAISAVDTEPKIVINEGLEGDGNGSEAASRSAAAEFAALRRGTGGSGGGASGSGIGVL